MKLKRKLALVIAAIWMIGASPAFAWSPPDRFTDNGNGTVTDTVTDLVWQQAYGSSVTWVAALAYCEGLTLASQSDWRLPNVKELTSLVLEDRGSPAIDTTAFPSAESSYYWSSSSFVGSNHWAWYVYFLLGSVVPNDKANAYDVRCVRP